jgi:addiction module HigA family antidote
MKTLRDRRRAPTHPGAILREDVLPALRMSQQTFADRLGVSRVTVNTLLQERRDLSAELAARIAKLLGHTPESWIRMQEALDLWRIAQDPSRLAGITPLPREASAA